MPTEVWMKSDPATQNLEGNATLLRAFRQGERSALGLVFRHYAPDLAERIRRGIVVQVEGQPVRVGDGLQEHDVETLIQEIFVRAFAEPARLAYDGVRPYGAYLSTIARNLMIDRWRKARSRGRTVAFAEVEREMVEDAHWCDPQHRLEERELTELLWRFAESLVDPERSIFGQRYQRGKSIRECALKVGLSDIQVRRRDTRLRMKLLTYLKKAGFLKNARVTIGTSLLDRNIIKAGKK